MLAAEKAQSLLEKLAMEIVMAEPGSKQDPLLIRDLLARLRVELASDPSYQAVCRRIGEIESELVSVVESGSGFAASHLESLNHAISNLKSSLQPSLQSLGTAPKAATSSSAKSKLRGGDLPLVVNVEGERELLHEFVHESQEHLIAIEQGVLQLEENPSDMETLSSIFRVFHTFKGASACLNLDPIHQLAHELESLLELARQRAITVNTDIIDLILEGSDLLKTFISEIHACLEGKPSRTPFVLPTGAFIFKIWNALAMQKGEGSAAPPEVEAEAVSKTEAARPSVASSDPAVRPAAGRVATVRVDTQKLDTLLDLVGEMVITHSLVAQDFKQILQEESPKRNIMQLGRLTSDLQRITMSIRMVPIRSTFQKMVRLVRDFAGKSGKQIQLVMSGESTELDRTLVEEISDPLMHMVRNSVDHGIEKPADRMAHGKPPQGSIHLKSYHQGGNIIIEIADDGVGLNTQRILSKAIREGLVPSDAQLTETEIFNLIFAPGFSTAEVVSDISGRGVGMDVVQRNVEKLRGKIEIESVIGKGCKFIISLPRTLAIIDGLVVGVGSERYIIPTLSVRESFRPKEGMISTLHERSEMVQLKGRLYPLMRLHECFEIEPFSRDPMQSIAILVESDRQGKCLLVDRLIGKQEIVIKNLAETFQRNTPIAGAAILGDGRVGLILDISVLVKVGQNGRAVQSPKSAEGEVPVQESAEAHLQPLP